MSLKYKGELSVVIPAYNAAAWLPKSVPVLVKALKEAALKKVEIIVVDDGSTDDTAKVAKSLKTPYPLRVVRQENGGRFLARDTGTKNAKYGLILFIDTRIYIGEGSLKYALAKVNLDDPRARVWNSHVHINKDNIYARFWEAITFNVWHKYFANPRHISYGLKDFDKYPKGTTCMLVSKDVMAKANKWFSGQTRDLRTSNDDTLLLRGIAAENNINIGPDFHCFYNSRTSLRQFTKHVFHRGKVFVDGFLRNDGNPYFLLIILFLLGSALAIPFAFLFPVLFLIAIMGLGFLWLVSPLIMMARKTQPADALSFFLLSPLFSVLYGAGIWTAFVKQFILKSARPDRTEGNEDENRL